jgi:hypothetical protein
MKFPPPGHFSRAGTQRTKAGMAVIVVVTILAIILLYIAYNARTLYHLGRELQLLDQKQTRRLSQTVVRSNAVPVQAEAQSPRSEAAPKAQSGKTPN